MSPRRQRLDLATLTGVRSGKASYYRAYVRSDERMQHAVRAMDSISRALVRTVEGPRGLLEEVVRAAAAHLNAEWTVLALADGQLPGARPRFLGLGRRRRDHRRRRATCPRSVQLRAAVDPGRPHPPGHRADRLDPGADDARGPHRSAAWSRQHRLEVDPEPGDLSVLRILANQAAVSLHTSEQYQAGVALHRRAQRLYDEATAQARDLGRAHAELRHVEERLLLAHQRELIDSERHRIARELHDSVTQYVLSAGMAVEMARGEAEELGDAGRPDPRPARPPRRSSSQDAVEQLRRAIYALHQPHRDTVSTLPELLHEVAHQHRPHLQVQLRVEGDVVRLPDDADHEIARTVGEALFNVATHAQATRAIVRLRYRPDELTRRRSPTTAAATPTELSRKLRLERGRLGRRPAPRAGQHETPDRELGGSAGVPARPARRGPRRDAASRCRCTPRRAPAA